VSLLAQACEGELLRIAPTVHERRAMTGTGFPPGAEGCLVSRSSRLFGFVPIQGAGAHQDTLLVTRGGEVTLRFDDEFHVDASVLEEMLNTPRVEVWTGSTIGRFELWADAHLWLASAQPGFCRVVVDQTLDTGLIFPPGRRSAASAIVAGGNFAYVTTHLADEENLEWGVHAFGTDANKLAEDVAELLRLGGGSTAAGPVRSSASTRLTLPMNSCPRGTSSTSSTARSRSPGRRRRLAREEPVEPAQPANNKQVAPA
ncbi:MAG: hypothetical protein ACRDSN_22185, partial [Pseudonocardiaceae bacterium]